MKTWKLLTATIALTTFAAVPALAEEEVKVYNWAEYMGDTTLADFTKETGIKVTYDTYDTYDSIESMEIIHEIYHLP